MVKYINNLDGKVTMRPPTFHLTLFSMIYLIFSISGCSSSSTPATPSIHPQSNPSSPSPRHLFALYTIDISSDHSTFTITPDRTASMHLNATRLLEKAVCSNCLSIDNAKKLPNGEFGCDITLRHPFPGLKKYTAFDVRGILISDTDYTFAASGRKVAWGDGLLKLINTDGYTPLFNPTEFPETGPGPAMFKYITGKYSMGKDFTSTLNPYLAYSEDQPRRIFTAGSTQTRKALLHLPAGPFRFGYAVDGCWEPVANVVDPLTDFPSSANCNEAYKIKVNMGSILPDAGSSVQVQVEVFDHQGIDTISSVTIEAPDLFNGEISLVYSATTGPESFLYSGTITNELGAYIAEYPMLIRVVDTGSDQNFNEVDSWKVASIRVGPKEGWARTWGGTGFGAPYGKVALDNSGNIYVVGSYGGTMDFDPGPGIDERTSSDGSDLFLSKFNQEGVFQWALTWGGPGYDEFRDITIDNNGCILVTGEFSGVVDFDPGPGVYDQGVDGDHRPFISKFDSDGNFLWAITWGSDILKSSGDCRGITCDSSGNVYATGCFGSVVDFDPGPGEALRDPLYFDAYLTKYSSDGSYQWVQTWSLVDDSGSNTVTGSDIIAPSWGGVYVVGYFGGTCDFDPTDGVDEHASEGRSAFMSRFTSSGTFLWALTWGGISNPGSDFGPSIASDTSGSVYVGWYFKGIKDFDPGDGVLEYKSQGIDAFLSKFNSTGELQWVDTWGGKNAWTSLKSLAVDGDGNPVVSGDFGETVDFDPGPGVCKITPTLNGLACDIFASKFYSDGSFEWVRSWGNEYNYDYSTVAADSAGNIFVTGYFYGSLDFDPGPDIEIHTSTIDQVAIFLTKLTPSGYW
jgi:hypothetical protein